MTPDPNEMPESGMTATEMLAFQAAFKKSCDYLNETPELISLLYDLDLMPEQLVSDGAKSRLICIVEHFRAFKKRSDLAPTSQWRDISSAPMDGTKIIVYRPVFQGSYIPQVGTDYFGGRRRTWQESNDVCQPTMWQPLPAPPTKDLAAAEGEKV